MGRIEYHRSELTHGHQTAHIDHQIAIPEGCAAFCQPDPVLLCIFITDFTVETTCFQHFCNRVFHGSRGKELSFFNVNHGICLCRSDQKVCLAAQKSRYLQHIRHLSYSSRLGIVVYICQYLVAKLVFDFRKHLQPFFKPRSPEAVKAGTVGFVKTCFKIKIFGTVIMVFAQ